MLRVVCMMSLKVWKKKKMTKIFKKEMYNKLLEVYESGLNNWIEVFEKDNHKTKKEKHRLNRCKMLLSALEKVIQE